MKFNFCFTFPATKNRHRSQGAAEATTRGYWGHHHHHSSSSSGPGDNNNSWPGAEHNNRRRRVTTTTWTQQLSWHKTTQGRDVINFLLLSSSFSFKQNFTINLVFFFFCMQIVCSVSNTAEFSSYFLLTLNLSWLFRWKQYSSFCSPLLSLYSHII